MDNVITLKELAQELGMDRSHMRKYVLAQGYIPFKIRTADSRSQLTLALAPEDAEAIKESRRRQGYGIGKESRHIVDNGQGWFYVIQVVPDLAPRRIKLGFSGNIEARIQAHRTSAPTATLTKSWPCKRCWEKAVIDSVTRIDCKLIANEVFECSDLDVLVTRCDEFFTIMPSLC